ncbi:MAG: bacterial Ig-like domain-containing protein [Erysipelotrichaceae bacterium]|nr:bacterial Ig-like domain-containing protein [Erysipelotrichaceae bacterium]
MNLFQKCLLVWLVLGMVLTNSAKVSADEIKYSVADVSSGENNVLESFATFTAANNYFRRHVNEYDNLVIYYGEQVVKMEYGVVEFKTNDACTLKTEYRSTISKNNSTINGCYGRDAAYLYTDTANETVYFKLSGDTGYIDLEDVRLIPLELLNVRPSAYMNIDGTFYHLIKSQLDSDFYYKSLELDKSLGFLKDKTPYYSYDGNYFYEDYKTMIDDYLGGTYENAVNFDNPYYNYYQYLNYRSFTNYEYSDIEKYFYEILMIDGKISYYEDQVKDGANDIVNKSQLYGELKAFVEGQNVYGVNALSSLAMAVVDSSYGKSESSFKKNNVFAYSAYHNDEERERNSYNTIEEGIHYFIKYFLSDKYAFYRSGTYNGAYFGNKLSGLNKEYSNNPYYGEEAASFYFKFDSAMGYKDKDAYCLGIVDAQTLRFYNPEDEKEQLFKQTIRNPKSFIILDETEKYYLVQLEASGNDRYVYDFNDRVALLKKDVFTAVLNPEKMHKNEVVKINFDADGGLIAGSENISMQVLEGQTPVVNCVLKDGYEFIDFDKEVLPALEEATYTAKYKEISSIKVSGHINKEVMLDGSLDLRNGVLQVDYKDRSRKKIPLNTNMIKNFDSSTAGESSITISYQGVEIEYPITVSSELREEYDRTTALISSNIENYQKNQSLHLDELKSVKKSFNKLEYVYDMESLRDLDGAFMDTYHNSAYYCIDPNDYSLSVSGLALSVADINITNLLKPFKDTYYVHIRSVNNNVKSKLETIASAYGFEVADFVNISYSLNMQSAKQKGATIISLQLPDKATDKIYSVYRYDPNGDIIKCKTIQSENQIRFLTKQTGDFAILSKDSVNDYKLMDFDENINKDNSDPNNHELFIMDFITLAVIVYGFIQIVIYKDIERQKEKLSKEYKKLLMKAK